jgi:hypothetical protein
MDVASEELRIVARGESLALPAASYRCVPSDALALSQEALDALVAPLRPGEAVRVETRVFEDDWLPAAVLCVDAPWLVLDDVDGVRATGSSGAYSVALIADEQQCCDAAVWEKAPTVRLGTLASLPSGWQCGGSRLVAHSLGRTDLRDWRWAWGGSSWGPIWLELQTEKSDPWLAAWLRSLVPLPYRVGESPPRAGAPNRALEGIFVRQSSLLFLRSYEEPNAAVAAIDLGILGRLAAGECGAFTWDLIDGESGSYLATGDDPGSLAEYLDPRVDTAELRSRWAACFALRTVHADGATAEADVWMAVSNELGLFEASTREAFAQALCDAPLSSLPRRLTVIVPFDLPDQDADGHAWFHGTIRKGQPRLAWTLTFALGRATSDRA